jgi:hypothetical protein
MSKIVTAILTYHRHKPAEEVCSRLLQAQDAMEGCLQYLHLLHGLKFSVRACQFPLHIWRLVKQHCDCLPRARALAAHAPPRPAIIRVPSHCAARMEL